MERDFDFYFGQLRNKTELRLKPSVLRLCVVLVFELWSLIIVVNVEYCLAVSEHWPNKSGGVRPPVLILKTVRSDRVGATMPSADPDRLSCQCSDHSFRNENRVKPML
eukprot:sb/3477524/